MARQLETRAENIAILCLIDSPAPNREGNKKVIPFSIDTERNLFMDNWPEHQIKEMVRTVSQINEIWPPVVNRLKENHFSVERIKALIPSTLVQAIPNYNQVGISELIYYLNVYRTFIHARDRYIPRGKINAPVHYYST